MVDGADRTQASPDRVTALWRRLKDHRIAQWTVGYVAVAYGIQHAVTLTTDAFDWPHAVPRLSMLLLALGLPLAMVFAWYHGERTTRRVSAGEMTLASLLLVLISLVFYAVIRPAEHTASSPALQEASVTTARAAAASPTGTISLAVLPFVNLSSDKEQEFFSDGMTEEITAALAKVPDLRVVARTSAFEFKGKNFDIEKIGRQLHATHLIEGSVRKEVNQIRITAQLVKADDGTHLWTESYDRELKGIFAVQEEIAQAIAVSLQVPLGLRKGETLVSSRIGDTASYEDYLRARALFRLRGIKPLPDTSALLEKVVARDPDYAPAWALLSLAYSLTPQYDRAWLGGDVAELRRLAEASLPRAEAAARRAIELDATLADGYEALGLARERRGKLIEAENLYRKALTFDANDPDTLHQYSQVLAEVGRFDEGFAMRQRLQSIEPLVPVFNVMMAGLLWVKGENEAAIAITRGLPPDYVTGNEFQSMIYASIRRYSEAADALLRIPAESFPPGTRDQAVGLLRSAPAAASAPNRLPHLGSLAFVNLYVGAPNRALENEEGNLEAGYITPSWALVPWHSSYAQVRKSERFKNLVRKAGLVEYWRAMGWPQQCHATTGDDFECS